MTEPKYLNVQKFLKEQIQQGNFTVGDYLPSENELCAQFTVTRTTVRKAMDELLKEGFIEKQQGKGSRVRERRKSLGLLTVKGFSEAVGKNNQTLFLQKPTQVEWRPEIILTVSDEDMLANCLYFERLRMVGDKPVMLEKNWFPGKALKDFLQTEFVDGSFFKTLSQKYLIEIKGSSQELRAENADKTVAGTLQIEPGSPVLHISVKFITNNPLLTIYSELYCNTKNYPVGNSYFI
jgi:DNA-binding GntR family transcriptional regulator